jgi:signal transduction histidine kinase
MAPWELRVPAPAADTLADLGPATIAVSIGLALAVALVSVAIVGAVRREHALVELRNRFVANVSHELKTPLSLIRMYAETLYLGRLREPAKQQEYLRVLLGEAERLSRMIGDVLDFARLREGAAVYRLTETDLRASVCEALRSYLPEWTARGAQVREEITADIPAVAHDAHGVVQLLLNLVDNAIKYAGEEPRITIRLEADRDRAVLEVTDDGPGIDAATHTRLWRALQRGEAAPEAEGSGLGLALVKQIADAHHASFVLDSGVDGHGVRAQISFPHYTGTT